MKNSVQLIGGRPRLILIKPPQAHQEAAPTQSLVGAAQNKAAPWMARRRESQSPPHHHCLGVGEDFNEKTGCDVALE